MGQAGAAAISGAVLRPAGLSHRSQRLLLPWLLLLAVFTQAALPSSVPSNVCGNWQEKYTKLHRWGPLHQLHTPAPAWACAHTGILTVAWEGGGAVMQKTCEAVWHTSAAD